MVDFDSWELGPFWCAVYLNDRLGQLHLQIANGDWPVVEVDLPADMPLEQIKCKAQVCALDLLNKWKQEITVVNCPACNADGKVTYGSACGKCENGKAPWAGDI
jgi:hypothetical protein